MDSLPRDPRSSQLPVSGSATVLLSSGGHENPATAAFCGSCGTPLQTEPSCSMCGRQNPSGLKFCRGCGTRLVTGPLSGAVLPPVSAMPATLAAGRYRIVRLLGEGAKKRVYLAHDTLLAREVALALFKAEGLEETVRTSIRREAQALGQLGNHPHIVTLYDAGEENGQPYFVSQDLAGGSVQELLKNADCQRLSLEHALTLADEICQALAHAHQHGIIHRDLKPSNVWLAQDGHAKLGDFGLATSLDRSRFTLEGVLIGTAAYLPPEQLQGRKLDARSDLYSLGVILYEMVAGRPPFVGDSLVSLIAQHLNAMPVAPSWHNPEVPPSLDALILQLLAKLPEDRPQSALAVRDVLGALASSPAPVSEPRTRAPVNSLDRLAGEVFVGREREMDELREGLEEALAGRGRPMLLLGEPGIGKTRTATELATYARLRGAQVLIGHCHEENGAPPFWPWVQILRAYMANRDANSLRVEMGAGGADIAQVVTEVRERLPDIPLRPTLEPEQARFRFFDSVTTFLKNAARAQPLVLILDDLQWADVPSLLLLQFLVGEMRGSRLLIIVTCREGEPDRQQHLAHTLAAVVRAPGSQTLQLGGLAESDVSHFIELTTGQPADQAVVSAVYKETEGNPFFVTEVVRLLTTESNNHAAFGNSQSAITLTVPQSVRSVIERRLAHLSEECRQLLAVAAVIGREFDLGVLESVETTRRSRPEEGTPVGVPLLEILDEAVDARLLTAIPHNIGRYSFSHALVRETLYESLSLGHCVRLHAQIGEVLEDLSGAYPDLYLTELARRFFLAAQYGGNVDKAIDYARRAGERAGTLLAYEEAVGHYERALQILEYTPDTALQCELLVALGEAQYSAGNSPQARETFQKAADLARTLRVHDETGRAACLLARAALGFGGEFLLVGVVDKAVVSLLEEALVALGEEDSTLRARVLGRLAMELYQSDQRERCALLSRQAVEIARRIGDSATLSTVLSTYRYAIWAPDKLQERLTVVTELVQGGEEVGNKEMALRGHHWRVVDRLEEGDLTGMGVDIEAHAHLATELRQRFHLWYSAIFRAMRNILTDQFEDGEQLVQQALALGQQARLPMAVQMFGMQLFVLRREQGRLHELESAVKRFAAQAPAFAITP